MPLAAGTRLGPYEIVAPIGSGGMGDVYKARDTRLQRTVAIKVLPPHVLADSDLRARFEREALAISSLDHPNICVVFDVGREGDLEYLVMQYLDGETLAQRLARGPLPLAEALRFAVDIAGALDRAHRAGILHRDVKPGNVMLVKSTGQGVSAKLLDFGLAKSSIAGPVAGDATATSPLTGRGVVVGTLLYMSPEQLEGADVDARSDVFSFGAMLYEMVTGRRAFEGASQASIIGAILEREPPPMTSIVPVTPPALDRVVRKCLAKDRERRWQSAADLGDELAWIAQSSGVVDTAAVPAATLRNRPGRRRWFRPILLGAAGFAVVVTGATLASLSLRNHAPADPIARDLAVAIPETLRLTSGGLAISPDGRSIVFVATEAPRAGEGAAGTEPVRTSRLYLRQFGSSGVTVIEGTEAARSPFFSPDGQSVGFFTARQLKKVSLRGGKPAGIGSVPPVSRGGAWLPDDSMIVAPTQSSPLVRIAPDGSAKPFTTLREGERAHLWPQPLPGRADVLYTISRGTRADVDAADIGIVNVATGEQRLVLKSGAFAQYSPTGHLVFVRGGTLSAVPFDLKTTQVTGAPVPFFPGLAVNSARGGAHYAVGSDGAIVCLGGLFPESATSAAWVDRTGRAIPAAGFEGTRPQQPRISPDGAQAAYEAQSPQGDFEVYVADVQRGTAVRISSDPEDDFDPTWTRDGRQLVWTAMPAGRLPFLAMRRGDGTGAVEELFPQDGAQFAGSISPSRVLAYAHDKDGASDIWVLPLDGDRKGHPFIETAAFEYGPEFSPDGKWIAYVSNESGTQGVYVVPYPGPGPKRRVSAQGGVSPVWSRDGRELFFQADDGLMSARVTAGADIQFDTPRRLFGPTFMVDSREDGPRGYDVSPDGQRFLMLRFVPAPAAVLSFHVLLDWAAALKPAAAR